MELQVFQKMPTFLTLGVWFVEADQVRIRFKNGLGFE
jgi:hypothetical protein